MPRFTREEKRIWPKSEVRESCIGGADCDGVCREKHYAFCCVHAHYFLEYRGKRKAKIYCDENGRPLKGHNDGKN